MESRLQWIVRSPKRWMHWEPLSGGLQTHALLSQRYSGAECCVVESSSHKLEAARKKLARRWWEPSRWSGGALTFQEPQNHQPPAQPVEMLWANMALHHHPDPARLLKQWSDSVAVDGFLMFSCLGPDTLRELRGVYSAAGWPPPSHEYTDMHDWGDMLVQAGFAEPVMDMERITLTYSSAQALLDELRGLGRNLHPQRFAGLRGRGWLNQLRGALHKGLASGSDAQNGRLQMTFEIIYGHAFKPAPRLSVQETSVIALQDMRAALARGRNTAGGSG